MPILDSIVEYCVPRNLVDSFTLYHLHTDIGRVPHTSQQLAATVWVQVYKMWILLRSSRDDGLYYLSKNDV